MVKAFDEHGSSSFKFDINFISCKIARMSLLQLPGISRSLGQAGYFDGFLRRFR